MKETKKETRYEKQDRSIRAQQLICSHLEGHNCTIGAPYIFTDFIVFEITEYTGDQYTLIVKGDKIFNNDFDMIREIDKSIEDVIVVEKAGYYAVIKLFANKDDSINVYGDIYDTLAECEEQHPDDEILTGYGIMDLRTGFAPDESLDFYEDFENALADAVRMKKAFDEKKNRKELTYEFKHGKIESCFQCPLTSKDPYGAEGCSLLNDYLCCSPEQKDPRCLLTEK